MTRTRTSTRRSRPNGPRRQKPMTTSVEKESDSGGHGRADLYLRSLPSRIGKAFLDYLYTGTCELDEADLPSLLTTAVRLEVTALTEAAIGVLVSRLGAHNAPLYYTAELLEQPTLLGRRQPRRRSRTFTRSALRPYTTRRPTRCILCSRTSGSSSPNPPNDSATNLTLQPEEGLSVSEMGGGAEAAIARARTTPRARADTVWRAEARVCHQPCERVGERRGERGGIGALGRRACAESGWDAAEGRRTATATIFEGARGL